MENALEIMKKEYNAMGPKWRFKTDELIPCPFHPDEAKLKPTLKRFNPSKLESFSLILAFSYGSSLLQPPVSVGRMAVRSIVTLLLSQQMV
jgi:hypothetical protein